MADIKIKISARCERGAHKRCTNLVKAGVKCNCQCHRKLAVL